MHIALALSSRLSHPTTCVQAKEVLEDAGFAKDDQKGALGGATIASFFNFHLSVIMPLLGHKLY